ncbi:hypothetical protein LC653_32380 [Nostoc sp. CHAB 5784]|uniref:hypothetical protein n=1 Tax=Nostoc mirabile TaxID=2907820 RepID=UPI001E5CB47D|nr:hypothetical protein [Nostoc mirabile]MCC5668425.1 hypothetical protein [Nostoc mirabile CHAB5784]
MKKFQIAKFGLIATAALSAIASSIFPAAALKYGSADVYRVGSGSSSVIYFHGTASSSISADIGYVSKVSSKLAGACGEIVLSSSTVGTSPTLKVNSTTVTIASLPTQLLPTCTSGSFAEARSANFKTPDGKVVLVGNTAGTSATLDVPKATVKTVKINACGFGSFKGSDSAPLPTTFKVGSTTYTVASLPNAMDAPKCTSGVGYVPASWLSVGGGS